MAIALNRGNAHSTRSSLKSIACAGQTPAASVWEPAVREPRVNRVRTLDSVARTPQRNAFEQARSFESVEASESMSRWESVRSNLALGAVFGAAVFSSILFAGFNASDEPVTPAPTVSSSSFSHSVQTR
ncbi:hypothetical protein [Corynebacterium stationis]|uniref:hypothetical protein n=1 Tax=Corynebacterium stationis TaxID=1705 RepID=UPI002639A076|nr:hypothetical protein [Corynebacterium stationis]